MNSKILLVLRILFGVFLVFFGVNKFYPMLEMVPPESALGYWEALSTAGVMKIVAILEILAGLALLFNKFAPLMMVILMSISINAVLYHLAYDSATIGGAIVLLVLNLVMLFAYKDKYRDLLN